MAEFLNTSATTFYLERLIKEAQQFLYIISPFLQFNDRIKELLAEKDRAKIVIKIVYGKSELAPSEINWLESLDDVRTSFCKNLHAKCYISDKAAIITSMNLYDFSQVNNYEMGVYILNNDDDLKLYQATSDEVRRIIASSEGVQLSAKKVEDSDKKPTDGKSGGYEKLTTSNLAKHLGMRTADLNDRLMSKGWLQRDGDEYKLTDTGKKAGGEARYSKQYGQFFLWPKDLSL